MFVTSAYRGYELISLYHPTTCVKFRASRTNPDRSFILSDLQERDGVRKMFSTRTLNSKNRRTIMHKLWGEMREVTTFYLKRDMGLIKTIL